MKYIHQSYWHSKGIRKSLSRIHDEDCKLEHRTSTAADGLLHHYFTNDKFLITPEQRQELSWKKPDYTVERLDNNDNCHYHAYVEVKSISSSASFTDGLDQLSDAITNTVDFEGGLFSVFAIIMKGSKLAIYTYYSFASLLDEYNILNYKGFVPLNYTIPFEQFVNINSGKVSMTDYFKYISTSKAPGNSEILRLLHVESTNKLDYPHIWDANNESHSQYVHDLFMRIRDTIPGEDIKD